ncbi:MerR family transcriptional regulator [Clostridium estertheticum]|uniref:MerR family transcriptional regulator n=1 Tax=Clostridium estertheticum TaxID=238834 RepID=UPI001CF1AC64|nr:MerR family transcriptional regulator [Clostridium estertheticum]MCB2343377.1 MerR family transcriptional regulator [Clostridium estertheticum]
MTKIINDELYSIGQICELLVIENFNLRYIEKTVGLDIKRNNAGERMYSSKDIETFKFIFELKDKGLNYKAIKKVLEHQEEIVVDSVDNEVEEGLIIPEEKLQKFMSMIKNTIDESIENRVNSKLEGITNSIEILVKQNKELKQELEHEQEKHFMELDRKLTKLREDQQENEKKSIKYQEEKNKSWFKKFFKS